MSCEPSPTLARFLAEGAVSVAVPFVLLAVA